MRQILLSRLSKVVVRAAMARRPYERLVLFSASTCGKGGVHLGADESEVCLLAWQVIDTANIQVGINWSGSVHMVCGKQTWMHLPTSTHWHISLTCQSEWLYNKNEFSSFMDQCSTNLCIDCVWCELLLGTFSLSCLFDWFHALCN